MERIETSVVINRPVKEVFAFLEDPANDPQWQSGLLEAEYTSEGPLGVGTTAREVRKLLGRRIESTYEITEYEPDSKMALKTTSGPIPIEQSASFEAVEEGTKVTLVGEFEPGGFFKLAEPIVGRVAKRQFEADVANLKELLEAQPEGGA